MKQISCIAAACAALAACSQTPEIAAQRFLNDVSDRIVIAAASEGQSVDPAAAVGATLASGGAAVFLPTRQSSGDFVGWLELPPGHACSARLPSATYSVTADVGARIAQLSFRQLEGSARLDGLTVRVDRIRAATPATPMARIAMGPDSFVLGRWFTCSDGVGHCGYALTLDSQTPECGG